MRLGIFSGIRIQVLRSADLDHRGLFQSFESPPFSDDLRSDRKFSRSVGDAGCIPTVLRWQNILVHGTPLQGIPRLAAG